MPIKSLHNEAELLRGIAEDDEKSFAALFYGYHQQLAGYVMLLTDSKEITQDIVQQVFIKIWECRKDFYTVRNFNSWLFILTRNITLNFIRTQVREQRKRTELENHLKAVSNESESQPSTDFDALIEQAIEQLPPQQKRVYTLKQKGHKNPEIGTELGISTQSVIKYQQLALKSIAQFVKSHSEFAALLAILAVIEK